MSSFENTLPANSNHTIRLGTRASQLAMWQSRWVEQQLKALGANVELIQIKTEGDLKGGALSQIGGQGLFTRQLQIALLENRIDLAVHSLKDLPTASHPDLMIAAVPRREDTSDAWVSNSIASFADAPNGSIIGTGSVRRAAQLRHQRPDVDIRDIRGNVDTRLAKLDDGQYDAIVLATAGLKRLGLEQRIRHRFDPDVLMPAVGQGALGLETRKDDAQTNAIVAKLNHAESFFGAMAERALLQGLSAGCMAPVGASTNIEDQTLSLTAIVMNPGGTERIEANAVSSPEDFAQLGTSVALQLFEQGAQKLLDAVR